MTPPAALEQGAATVWIGSSVGSDRWRSRSPPNFLIYLFDYNGLENCCVLYPRADPRVCLCRRRGVFARPDWRSICQLFECPRAVPLAVPVGTLPPRAPGTPCSRPVPKIQINAAVYIERTSSGVRPMGWRCGAYLPPCRRAFLDWQPDAPARGDRGAGERAGDRQRMAETRSGSVSVSE